MRGTGFRIPEPDRIRFLAEWARIHEHFSPIGGYFGRPYRQDFTSYQFVPYTDSLPEFERFFDAFQLNDDLTVRTSSYFVKAAMLWMNPVFGEEAIANVFFCLEGCLLLIQRKAGLSPTQINLEELRKIFAGTFSRGDELFEFIEEAYAKRIELVHAAPAWGVAWSPWLSAEDYYEYLSVSKNLLNYVMVNRILED